MPNLPTSLLPAMWRYIPFEAREIGREVGRVVVTHEFPQEDEPQNEDMRRKTRKWKIQGFVVGEAAFAIRDLMMEACETKGPGPLLHPTLGLIQARCTDLAVREATEIGKNVVEFTFDFVESGEVISVGLIASAVALAASAVVTVACQIVFATRNKTDGESSDVKAQAAADHATHALALAAVADKLTDRTGGAAFKTAMQTIAASASSLSTDQVAAAGAWQAAFAGVTSAADLRTITAALGPQVVASQAALSLPGTRAGQRMRQNTAATDLLLYVSALAYAHQAASAEAFTTWDDAVSVRDGLSERVSNVLPCLSDPDVFAGLQDLRGAMVKAVSQEAVSLPRLRTLSVLHPVPAVVLAFDLYGTPDRAMEIVNRNGLSDPNAVCGTLRVVTA